MNALAVALGITLEDGLSGGPARKIVGALKSIQTAGKNAAKDLSNSFKRGFSVDNIDLALKENERKLQAAKGRLTQALAMAATIAVPVVLAANFEDELIDFMKVAELPLEKMAEIEAQLVTMSRQTGKSKSELLTAVSGYVGKGLDYETSMAALVATGRAATATKASVEDMSRSGFSVMDNLNVGAVDLAKAFNIMAVTGKEGSFELNAMARKFPEITAGAKSLKMEGVSAVASLAAALQISMKSAGGEDQAATNFSNFLGKITAPDTVKKFKKMGVNLENEMKIAEKKGIDVLDHMLGIIAKKTGGDAFKMGELFQDKQVLDFLKAIIPNLEEYRRIRDKAANGPDVIGKDFSIEAFKAKFAFKMLGVEIDNLLGSSGSLLPLIKETTLSLTDTVRAVGEWTVANPELTKTIVLTTAGLLAFGVASRIAQFAFYGLRGGVISTIAAFFKFNDAGKNVSIVARSLGVLATVGRFAFASLAFAGTGIVSTFFAMAGGIATVIASVTAPIWATGAAIVAVVAGIGFAVYKYWEPISNFVSGFAGVIGPELSNIYGHVAGFASNMASLAGSWAKQKLIDFGSWLGFDDAQVGALLDRVIQLHVDFGASVVGFFTSLPSQVGDWLSSVFSVKQYSEQAKGDFKAAGADLAQAIVDGIKLGFETLYTYLIEVPSRIIASIGSIDLSNLIKFPSLPKWLGGSGDVGAQLGDNFKEPAYQKSGSTAPTSQAPIINNTFSPTLNVNAKADIKNEANINKIAQKVGAMTARKTRLALTDAGAE